MRSKVNFFLQQLLTKIEPYDLSEEDKKKVARNPEEFILNKITRSSFRKRKLDEKTSEGIRNKISLSINEDIPLHFTIPFGGYKHFWNPSHPEPDFAELFNFRYLTDLVLPALSVHQPGAVIEYVSEDLILNRMDNYPEQDLEEYSQKFKALIYWFNQHTPENLEFKFFRVVDRVDTDKLIAKVEELIPERRKAFDLLSQEDQEKELHRSYRSIFWNGAENWHLLSEKEKKDKVIESRLIELAYYDTEFEEEFLGNYFGEENHICILFSFGTTKDNDAYKDLTIGSTYGSIVDHWIGRGVLKEKGDTHFPTIVSKEQYYKIKDKVDVVEVNIKGLSVMNNFSQIDVVSAKD